MGVQNFAAPTVDGIHKLAVDEQPRFDVDLRGYFYTCRHSKYSFINADAKKECGARPSLRPNSRPAFDCLKLYRIRRQLARRIALGQRAVVVFPNHQNGALGRISTMTYIGRHRRYVTRFHGDLCARFAGLAVFDVPNDLISYLDEPLHTIIAV